MCEHVYQPGALFLSSSGVIIRLVERGPGWRCHLWCVEVLAATERNPEFRDALGKITEPFLHEEALTQPGSSWRQFDSTHRGER